MQGARCCLVRYIKHIHISLSKFLYLAFDLIAITNKLWNLLALQHLQLKKFHNETTFEFFFLDLYKGNRITNMATTEVISDELK
jgi:hypothetical protein